MLRTMRVSCAILLLLLACETGGLPQGWAETPAGSGPRIQWDLNNEPLPEIPLPNDVATWPDPTSPTGRRINVSLIAPTQFESLTRENFDQVDGWGTFQAITMSFDEDIDIEALFDAQGGTSDAFSETAFGQHAVYLVNMETGDPVPLDINSGNFHYVLDKPEQYWRNDPRAGESNLLFETVDEDTNGNGVLDPGEDTDYDGVLDQPNTWDGTISGPNSTVDDVPWFWERETKTLILRPIIPLLPKTTYAVVITDRLVGMDGQPVRSPFDMVHPVTQIRSLERLPDHFSNHPAIYGDLARRGWEGVAFAWTYTTQSVYDDIDAVRAGLYGEGTMGYLQEQFPNNYVLAEMQGGRRCDTEGRNTLIAPAEQFISALNSVAPLALELNADQTELVVNSYDALSHIVVTYYDSPYFLGDPYTTGLEDSFVMDYQTGEARVDRETIAQITFVPKETEEHQQPFDVAYYVHGHGSASAEPLPFVGFMLQNGVAVNVLNAEGHGVPVDESLATLLRGIFEADCLGPMSDAILTGRAEDLNGDGDVDSGGDFYSAYLFHTRDTIRQSVIDHMRSVQLFRSFDGRLAEAQNFENGAFRNPVAYDADVFAYDGADVAGDFDGDGVPDAGGPDAQFLFTGGSLGGIVTGVMGGAEPALRAAAPIVGAGGLADVAVRVDLGGVLSAVHLRMMGPMVITEPANERREDRTRCGDDQVSMYIFSNDVLSRSEMEIACIDELGSDDVVLVRNFNHDELECSGAIGGVAGRFRVNYASDARDPIAIEIYRNAREITDFGHCTIEGNPGPDDVIDTFRLVARFQDTIFEEGEPLVSPTVGFGNQRQTPDLRRLLGLAQAGFEPADPINYARRVFLDPIGHADAPALPTNLFVITSIGDQSVPSSTGNAYARAAGLNAFLPADAPDSLAEWRAPAYFAERYPGLNSPNDVLIEYHVLEGVDRMNRHPIEGADHFLFDVDNLSDGRLIFHPNGREQYDARNEEHRMVTGLNPPALDPPLRWVRQTSTVANAVGDDVWSVLPGDDVSGFLNFYSLPIGVHGFDSLVFDQELPWDPAQYLINLIARWGATGGQDLQYLTSPEGHQCLEDSTCEFLNN